MKTHLKFCGLDTSKMRVTFYTGAGISEESGVPTFRESDGLWSNYDPSIVSSVNGWDRDADMFKSFWTSIVKEMSTGKYKPNRAHKAIAKWESMAFCEGNQFNVITTNVDNLHEMAGSMPLKVHGDLLSVTRRVTMANGEVFTMPDVVLFGDQKKHQEEMWDIVQSTDLFVVVGSSLSIYGDSGMLYTAKDKGARCVEINTTPTKHPVFDLVIPKIASEGISELYQMVA